MGGSLAAATAELNRFQFVGSIGFVFFRDVILGFADCAYESQQLPRAFFCHVEAYFNIVL